MLHKQILQKLLRLEPNDGSQVGVAQHVGLGTGASDDQAQDQKIEWFWYFEVSVA